MNSRYILYISISLLTLFSCSDTYEADENNEEVFGYINPQYPVDVDTLRILAIGNSFSFNSLNYIESLIDSSHIDKKKICIYDVHIESATFNTWIMQFENNTQLVLSNRTSDKRMQVKGTISQLVSQNWDVIVIQQASDYSNIWSSYRDLKKLIPEIINNCPNKKLCLAFQLVWSHKESEMPSLLDENIMCCKKMIKTYGIDVIIPTGTAIQLARGTSLNDGMYLTKDNWHLNDGIGNYIAACTWYETLITPVFHESIIGNNAMPIGNYSKEQILLGQRCAYQAVLSPYDYTNVSSLYNY